jgi:hypothetical protein
VAILEFKADKQRADSLAEVKSAGFERGIPMDPYGDESRWSIAEGESFTLYSRGCDFEDDGGKAFANALGATRDKSRPGDRTAISFWRSLNDETRNSRLKPSTMLRMIRITVCTIMRNRPAVRMGPACS